MMYHTWVRDAFNNKKNSQKVTQEPNDDGGRDRVKFRDAIASKNLNAYYVSSTKP